MSDRKRAIETLKQLRLDYEEFYEEHNNEVTQAYDMAISSLETDEAYQIMYEGGEIFTKDEVMAMLTELRTEIDKQCKIPNNCASAYDWNNGVYACYKVIQQKIDALKDN